MKSCPNTNTIEWKKLVGAVGEIEAYRDFYQYQTIRLVEDVEYSIELRENTYGPEDFAASNITRSIAKYNREAARTGVFNLIKTLSTNLDIPYNYISKEDATKLLSDTDNPYTGEASFYYQGETYFIAGQITPEAVLHEFSHPLIDAVEKDNKALFNSLYKEASQNQELVNAVAQAYPDYSEIQRQKETIVFALSRSSVQEENPGLVKKILYAIRQLFRKIFGSKINVSNLGRNTSIRELAEMLKTQEFSLPFIDSATDTAVQYMRDINEFARQFERATSPVIEDIISRGKMTAAQAVQILAKAGGIVDESIFEETGRPGENVLDNLKKIRVQSIGERERNFEALNKPIPENIEEAVKVANLTTLSNAIGRIELILDNSLAKLEGLENSGEQASIKEIYTIAEVSRAFGEWADLFKEHLNNAKVSRNSAAYNIPERILNKSLAVKEAAVSLYTPILADFIWSKTKKGAQAVDKYFTDKIAAANRAKRTKDAEKLSKEYSLRRITRDTIEDMLLGRGGDLQEFNQKLRKLQWLPGGHWIEGLMNNPDPIVGALGLYLNEITSNVERDQIEQNSQFRNEIFPELVELGLDNSKPQEFWQQLIFLDQVVQTTPYGTKETFEAWSLLNPYKNYIADRAMLQQELYTANQTGNTTLVKELLEKRREMAKYFYNEYSDYYNSFMEKFNTPIGKLAMDKRNALYQELQEINEALEYGGLEGEAYDLTVIEKKLVLREIKRLSAESRNKSTEDNEIAKILKQYRQDTAGFFERKIMRSLFDEKMEREKQRLVEEGYKYGSEEFERALDKWVNDNTEVRATKEYYDYLNTILTELKTLGDKLGKPDLAKKYQEISDITAGYKNNEGEVEALELSDSDLKQIKVLHEEIEALRIKDFDNGLSESENETLQALFDLSKNAELSQDDRNIFMYLLNKRRSYLEERGIDQAMFERMRHLGQLLSELSKSSITDDYVEVFADHLDRIKEAGVIDLGEQLSLIYPTKLTILGITENATMMNTLLQDKEFSKWYYDNHYSKRFFDTEDKEFYSEYVPTSAWTVKTPRNEKMLESFVLSDGQKIYRTPTAEFQKRVLKDTYTDDAGVTHKLRREKVIGETVDVWDQWLPNLSVPNNPYRNEKYFELKKNNPKLAKTLDKVSLFHLSEQLSYIRGARMGYQVPRFNKDSLELIQGTSDSNILNNMYNLVQEAGKEAVKDSADDFERGYAYDPSKMAIISAIEDETRSIPIFGLSKLDNKEVSLNVINSMLIYHNSGIRQRALIQSNPMAQAFVNVLKSNGVTEINDPEYFARVRQESIENGVRMPAMVGRKSKNYDRLTTVERYYKREWLGQRNTNTRVYRKANKVLSATTKISSLALFALDLTSAAKNRGGQILQMNVEAIAGKDIGMRSYARGKRDAWIGLVQTSRSIYSQEDRSRLVNLLYEFNIDGMVEKSRDFSHRSFGRDAVNLSWLMSPRKFLQLQAGAEVLYSYLHAKKINMVVDGKTIETSLMDTFEMRDGKLQSKAGVPAEWKIGGEEYLKYRTFIDGKMERMAGNYKQHKQPILDTTLGGRLALYLRKYLFSMAAHRYAAGRVQWDTGEYETGYHRGAISTLVDVFKALDARRREEGLLGLFPGMGHLGAVGKLSDYMTTQDDGMGGTYRTAVDLAQITVINYLVAFLLMRLFDFDRDDPEKRSLNLLKSKTGPLAPSWFINDKRKEQADFDVAYWMALHGIQQLVLANQEAMSFLPYPTFNQGIGQQVRDVAKGGYAGPLEPVFFKIGGVLTNLAGYAADSPSAFYTRNVGPYKYQEKGDAKWMNNVMKMIGTNAQDIDPATGLEIVWQGEALRKR